MILLTIGTQLPFDRLVQTIDEIALELKEDVFGQVGNGRYEPRNFSFCRHMEPSEFEAKFLSARVIVSHAGIGSILTARKHKKPIVLFPRRTAFGEHRNDHQLATCAQLRDVDGVYVAEDAQELTSILSNLDSLRAVVQNHQSENIARMTGAIRSFLSEIAPRKR
jgi:UDP-N-acetylglucosamine transferase subunit ALG13